MNVNTLHVNEDDHQGIGRPTLIVSGLAMFGMLLLSSG